MKTIKYTLTIACFIGAVITANATTITSAQTGDWNVGSTWVGGVVPTANDSVSISPGAVQHLITVTQTTDSCASLSLNANAANFTNARIDIADGAILTVKSGDIAINGNDALAMIRLLGTGSTTLNVLTGDIKFNNTTLSVLQTRILMTAGPSILNLGEIGRASWRERV